MPGKVLTILKGFFSRVRGTTQTPVKQIYSKRSASYSPQKKKELELLCQQLFKRKELITSGKLQFIGLKKIKKRMGKRWEGLQAVVYDTAEAVMSEHLSKSDIFIRYQDDSYVIIFGNLGLEEGQIKALVIADEIRRRLFCMEEKELKDIEVHHHAAEIRTKDLIESSLDDTLNVIFTDMPSTEIKEGIKAMPAAPLTTPPQEIEVIEVEPEETQGTPLRENHVQSAERQQVMRFSYLPLWDLQRNALTSYICRALPIQFGPGAEDSKTPLLDMYRFFFYKRPHSISALANEEILAAVRDELGRMQTDGRKLFIVCPVHYETYLRAQSYEKYRVICQQMTAEQKKFLTFMVVDIPDNVTQVALNNMVASLKSNARYVYALLSSRQQIGFTLLRNAGFDAVGLMYDFREKEEDKIIEALKSFNSKAKAALLAKTFALDIPTLSITTSAVCSGFDFLGGPAIHGSVQVPDSAYRYCHEDLFAPLIKK